ncbi:MAG TPA: tRNA (adenosine(37)-N6)-threonylcarbamoyltransferase complex ATPase subunit type 1 TsaE [Beijerinckiaceae bacterium]|nr:tRNA (adenosine(37)-N6)-threonylcarbamoyltransferase complex ATPase subunit type 1 TsaE [Beijerinckiaceae bacterium]
MAERGDGGPPATWELELADEQATIELAQTIADLVRADDVVTLSGDLGAGKTTFARSMIRKLAGVADLEVPSPTFTLMQIYSAPSFQIVHADLYRIEKPEELAELGWEEAAEGALVLVEWPERVGDQLAADRLDIAFRLDPQNRDASFRRVVLSGYGRFAERLGLARALHVLLQNSGWEGGDRSHMQGDASTRAYERLTKESRPPAILMISPPRADGPPIRYGKSYGAIAHLAETIVPFLAIDQGLRTHGFSAPEIYASDSETGLAILEDLGCEGIVDTQGPIAERYAEATEVLARLHQLDLDGDLPIGSGGTYRIPTYDLDALSVEIELLLEWYAPHVAHVSLASGARASFVNLWREALGEVVAAKRTWTLRDYHSPNLLWLADRDGQARIGIIDFQDCVLGHPAYDVVSLLQDARVTVDDELELRLLSHYARARRSEFPGFDMAAFARAYAILGAQRATKILGIFARLDKRDHKPHYLAHLPRVENYLRKSLAHPILAALKSWYETNLPGIVSASS